MVRPSSFFLDAAAASRQSPLSTASAQGATPAKAHRGPRRGGANVAASAPDAAAAAAAAAAATNTASASASARSAELKALLHDELAAGYMHYVSAEPLFRDTDTTHSTSRYLVTQITAALCDAVTAVDHLKCAALMLEAVAADAHSHSSQLRQDFAAAADEVARAVHFAPVLVRRGELIRYFAQKRILVTQDSSAAAAAMVRKTERWLKAIVKDIGRDLVQARREARRVGSLESMGS